MSDTQTTPESTEPDPRFMEQMVDLEYHIVVSPTALSFAENMNAGRIVGHKCPSCAKVYVPPKGYCPMCVVETGEKDEVEIKDEGTVTSFTILTPIQYRGQKEKDDYALAQILMDGASGTVGQQRIAGIDVKDIRMGMRVKAVWTPPEEREADDDPRGWGLGTAIKHWEPTGEPDAPFETFKDHML